MTRKSLGISKKVLQIGLISGLSTGCAAQIGQDLRDDYSKALRQNIQYAKDTTAQTKKTGDCLEKLLAATEEKSATIRRETALLKPVDPKNLPERFEFLSVTGDPKIGTVVHLRQTHANPLSGERPAEEYEAVIVYQRRILEELIALKPHAIIPEGWQSPSGKDGEKQKIFPILTLRAGDLTQQAVEHFQIARKVVKNGFDSLTKEEAKALNDYLYMAGAGLLYYAGVPGTTLITAGRKDKVDELVDLYRTISKLKGKILALVKKKGDAMSEDDKKQLEKWMEEGKKINKKTDKLNASREKELVKQAMDFLKGNPGKTVATTYGSSHNFCDDFRALKEPPVLKSVSFPRLQKLSRADLAEIMQPCASPLKKSD